jgi:hypothetical protein
MNANRPPLALDAPSLDAVAERCLIDEQTRRALSDALGRFSPGTHATLASLAESLRDEEPASALARFDEGALSSALGRESTMLFWLALALALVPDGEARHRAIGVDPRITHDTFRDLALWTDHHRVRFGHLGITREIFEWTLYYQRARVFRVGMLQWELRCFDGPVIAVKPRSDDSWILVADDRATFIHGGRFRDKRAPLRAVARDPLRVEGLLVDPTTGALTDEHVSLSRAAMHAVIDDHTPMLDMHIPADAALSLDAFQRATQEAFAFFAHHFKGASPQGLFGEAWLLDPQVAAMLPSHAGLAAIQSVCLLYPGSIPEEKTLRRIFGPFATRTSVLRSPSERPLNTLQRAVVSLLEDPSKHLCARGGLMPNDRIEALARATGFLS